MNSKLEESTVIKVEDIPYSWSRNELRIDKDYKRGSAGKKVKIIQEWLSLNGHHLQIDGKFGPATEYAVRQYQEENDLEPNGIVNNATFSSLVQPMLRVLTPISSDESPYNRLVVDYAKRHLTEHPREIGGQNRGPWVRLYMHGNEGREWAWCAGFVCFILRQSADAMKTQMPLRATYSCDYLALDGKEKGIFTHEQELARGNPLKVEMPEGSIFLKRRTPTDWVHTGLAITFHEDFFETIEGNTNDDGDREGYEVCKRFRGYAKKDFVRI